MLIVANSPDFVKALMSFWGFEIGTTWKRKYVQFFVDGPFGEKVIRVVAGMFILVLLKFALKIIFPHTLVFDFIRYAMMTSVGIGIYPYVFKKINL